MRKQGGAGAGAGGVVYALFGKPIDPDALLQEGKALYAAGERMQVCVDARGAPHDAKP
jgi:hypothetical protein